MKLTPQEREVEDGLLAAAHANGSTTRAVAEALVDGLEELEGLGQTWARDRLRSFVVAGAQARCRTWRRRFSRPAKTKRGKKVQLPGFVGARATESLTLEALLAHRDFLAAQRDTISAEVSALDRLAERMVADDLNTVGEALARLDAA